MNPCLPSHSKPKRKKKYQIISNEIRQSFIDRVYSNEVTIKKVFEALLLNNRFNLLFFLGSSGIWFEVFNLQINFKCFPQRRTNRKEENQKHEEVYPCKQIPKGH